MKLIHIYYPNNNHIVHSLLLSSRGHNIERTSNSFPPNFSQDYPLCCLSQAQSMESNSNRTSTGLNIYMRMQH